MKLALFSLFFIIINCVHGTHLLIKIPTRERCGKFFSVLDEYHNRLSGKHKVSFLITCDEDDQTMNNPDARAKLNRYSDVFYYFGPRVNKIEAVNRDIDKHLDFDILVSASDDMIPIVHGYDDIIVEEMMKHFPDLDGALNFNDGYLGAILNTIPILGKKYYDRFGYIYFPEYQSLCCDIEFTIVSSMLNKEAVLDQVIIKHCHPVYGFPTDSLYAHNDSPSYTNADRQLLYRRKAKNFDIHHSLVSEKQLPTTLDLYDVGRNRVMWSILICTVEERYEMFQALYRKLLAQIEALGLQEQVEVVFFRDNKERSVGFKRNTLIQNARGKYVSFIDDDDDISNNYTRLIYKALLQDPDCVSLMGVLTVDGGGNRCFCHTKSVKKFFTHGEIYYRPPNHLNPIRKAIAERFVFPDQFCGEDLDWAMQICRSGLLKKESKIREPYYFYRFSTSGTLTQPGRCGF